MTPPNGLKDAPRNLKTYFLCLLLKGPRWDETEGEDAGLLLAAHLAYLRQHLESGKFAAAGPVLEDETLAGMVLIRTENPAEADALASGDPAVQAGRLTYKVRPVFLPSLESVRAEFRA